MAEKKSSSSDASNIIHYVVVVHGIGQQRKNETVLPVIKQFAAVRHNDAKQADFMTLGRLNSQSNEQPWIEYQDIPNQPDESLQEKTWIPRRVCDQPGKNIRFVDFCWSGITQEQHKVSGETTEKWSDSLINRLKLRVQMEEKPAPTQWIVDIMGVLQRGMLFTEKIMGFRIPKLSNEIFGEFLGDVEMYGDAPCTRGIAVRMFHEAMAKVHQAHCDEFGESMTPHYTIIAHSLGTIMTMDAIAYAHANDQSRLSISSVNTGNDLVHFPGYSLLEGEGFSSEKRQDLPSVEWVKYLYSYVTLGSPIDKYLALWTENYTHFENTDWMDGKLIADRKTKIRHFNYADEQDPVGHELNLLKGTPVWKSVMEMGEDVVFTRYAVPGVAHVDYWKDYDLFYRVLDLSIDKRDEEVTEKEKPQGHYVEWFDINIYRKALFISYIAIPIIGWLIATVSLNSIMEVILNSTSDAFPVGTTLIFLLTLYITHILMELIIKWRLVMVVARSQKSPMEVKEKRINARSRIRAVILWTPVLWGLLFFATFSPGINSFIPAILLPYLPTLQLALFLAFGVAFDIRHVYNKSCNRWASLKNTVQGTTFADFLKPLQKK